MPINRIRQTNSYTVITNSCLNDENLSFKAKGLLAYLLSKPDHWEVNVTHLSKVGKNGKESIYSALNELILEGYVQRNYIRGEKGKVEGIEYVIYNEKQSVDPDRQNPNADNPDGEKPSISKDLSKVNTEKREKPELPKLSLQERKEKLAAMISQYKTKNPTKYPAGLYTKFYNYWTEQKNNVIKNNPDALMRFEIEKFFEIGKRIATWWSRTNDFEKKKLWGEDPFLK